MAVAFQEKAAAQSAAASTTVTLNHPASLAAGDLMIAYFMDHAATDTSALASEPSGWATTVRQRVSSGDTDCTQWWSWKIATAGDVSAGSSTWTFSAAQNWHCPGIARFTGHDSAAPINQSAVSTDAPTLSHTSPSITTTVDGCLIVAMFGLASGTATWSALDGSLTSRYNATLQLLVIQWGDGPQASAGAVTKTATNAGSSQGTTMLTLAIAPSTGAPPPALGASTGMFGEELVGTMWF